MDRGVETPDLDTIYRLLSEARRRYVLYSLLESDRTSVDGLARQITALEQRISPESVSRNAAERVTVSLRHTHLPRLTDHGIITDDHQCSEVVAGANFDAIRSTVERAKTVEETDLSASGMFCCSDPVTETTDTDQ